MFISPFSVCMTVVTNPRGNSATSGFITFEMRVLWPHTWWPTRIYLYIWNLTLQLVILVAFKKFDCSHMKHIENHLAFPPLLLGHFDSHGKRNWQKTDLNSAARNFQACASCHPGEVRSLCKHINNQQIKAEPRETCLCTPFDAFLELLIISLLQ